MNSQHVPAKQGDSPSAGPPSGQRWDADPDRKAGPVAVIGADFSGAVRVWSSGAQSMFGWSSAEAVGRPLTELAEWGLTERDFAEFVFVGTAGAWTRELDVRDRSGRLQGIRVIATLGTAPDGSDEILATVRYASRPAGTGRPPTQRPFRLIAQRGTDLVLICDSDGMISYAGASLHEMLGYRHRDVIGATVDRYVHPHDTDRLRQEWRAAIATPGDRHEQELRIRDAAGNWRWVELRISNLLADIAVTGMVLNVRDVTETRSTADRLEVSDRLLTDILAATSEGVWVLDPSGRTLLANSRMAELLAVDLPRLSSGGIADFLDPVAARLVGQRLGQREAGQAEQYELAVTGLDGRRRRLLVRQVPRHDRSGTTVGGIAICTDVTDRGAPVGSEPAPPGLDRLSRRELEVVRMLLRGDRVPVIASHLFVSQSTVRNHLSSVFRKLRVGSQQDLIVLLRERKRPS
jgi:PAS domain S-box-containing protein